MGEELRHIALDAWVWFMGPKSGCPDGSWLTSDFLGAQAVLSCSFFFNDFVA